MSAATTLELSLPAATLTLRFAPPVASHRLLPGRRAEEAVALVGVLHNLCAGAHQAAARAALGLPAAAGTARAVMEEILREHLVVLCRAAPPLLGLKPVTLPVALHAPPDTRHAALGEALFGAPPGTAFCPEGPGAGSVLAPLFARLAQRDAALGLDVHEGPQAGDTTFLQRVRHEGGFVPPRGCGLLSERFMARLYEVHKLLAAFGTAAEAAYLPRVIRAGEARIAAARGMLSHCALLESGRVKSYAIDTPTRAMLDPEGPLPAALAALTRSPQASENDVRLVVLAFDPCVPYVLGGAQTPARSLADA